MAEVRADTARAVAGLLIRWPGPSGTPPQFIYTRRLTRQRGSPRSSLFSPGRGNLPQTIKLLMYVAFLPHAMDTMM